MKRKLVILALLPAIVFGLIKFAFISEARSSASPAASILPAQTQSTFSINDVSVTEGDSGTVNAVFTVTLSFSGFRDWTTSVDYSTADGTATAADNDYSPTSGTLSFDVGAGSVTTTISAPIVGDTRTEGPETFFVNLSNARTNPPGAVTIVDGQGVCTIVDNEAAPVLPTLSINDISVVEGNTGTVDALFTVSLSAASSSGVTVNFATANSSASIGDGDYLSRSGILTFPAGDFSPKTIAVPVVGDTRDEALEAFFVNLSGAVGATISDSLGLCEIVNDDGQCTFTTDPLEQAFPASGGTGSFSVAAPAGCAWSADPRDGWITITEGSGSGSGVVTYSVAANTQDGFTRETLIRLFERDARLASQFFRVKQAAAPCTFSVSPTRASFPSGLDQAGTSSLGGSVRVNAPLGCAWRAVANVPWIRFRFTDGSSISRSGSAIINYELERNSGPDRTGTITVAGQTVTVDQDGFSNCPGSAFTLSSTSVSLPSNGSQGLIRVGVSAPEDCLWTATTTAPWIRITPQFDGDPPKGEGNGSFDYQVDPNYTVDEHGLRTPGSWRSGLIAINGQPRHSVYQDGSDCIFELFCHFLPGVCGEQSPRMLSQARDFRDDVLARTPRGRNYTQLYYKSSPEAVAIAILNPSLIWRSREMLERYRPVLDSMIRGEQVTLTQGDLDQIEGFLNAFADKSSSQLCGSLKSVCEDLRNPQVQTEFHITVADGEQRALPAKVAVLPVNPTGMLIVPLGLLLLGLLRVRPRAKAAKSALRRLLCVTIVISVGAGQWSIVRGQTTKSCTARTSSTPDKLPLSFEANHGQLDSQVKFLSRVQGGNLYLTPREAVLVFSQEAAPARADSEPIQLTANRTPRTADVLRMKLIGADPDPRIRGLEEISRCTNYFIGDGPKWRTDVQGYARVKYENVYGGVDLVYYGSRRELEYDFRVAPGADPRVIRVKFEGARDTSIDSHGDLVLKLAGAELRQRKPVVYQEVNGSRRQIPARYVLSEETRPHSSSRTPEVRFEIGDYDRTRPLIIDPVLAYSTYFGGSGNEESNSIAVDSTGNVYVTGFTDSVNFPLINPQRPNLGGQQDAFVIKLDPSGTRVLYSTYIGGNGQDNGTSIAVDSAGNAYITGFTDSKNFPARDAVQPSNQGDFNAFVVKLDSSGSLVNSTLLGGTTSDYGSSIAVDSAGSVYVAGLAASTNFPMIGGAQQTPGGLVDAYVTKIDPSGKRLIYSTYLGGSGIDGASSVAVDSAGNVYVTGLTSSHDFRTVNALQATHGGGLFDAFVAKLNPSGSQVIYSTYLGGSREDRAFRIAVNAASSAYVIGDTDSTDFPLANAAQQSNAGSTDAFVAKLNPSGNQLVYSTYLGGSGIDGATAIAVDPAGSAYVTGFTASTNFPTANPVQGSFGGAYDGFVSRLSASGSSLDYSTYLGGSGVDSAFGVATDSRSIAYVMGVTASVNFPTANPLQPMNGGGAADIFIAKIRPGPIVSGATLKGKKLSVFGTGFDDGATLLLNGEPQKTANDSQNPTTVLIARNAGRKIGSGPTVSLQVRNQDGTVSNTLRFTVLKE